MWEENQEYVRPPSIPDLSFESDECSKIGGRSNASRQRASERERRCRVGSGTEEEEDFQKKRELKRNPKKEKERDEILVGTLVW